MTTLAIICGMMSAISLITAVYQSAKAFKLV